MQQAHLGCLASIVLATKGFVTPVKVPQKFAVILCNVGGAAGTMAKMAEWGRYIECGGGGGGKEVE